MLCMTTYSLFAMLLAYHGLTARCVRRCGASIHSLSDDRENALPYSITLILRIEYSPRQRNSSLHLPALALYEVADNPRRAEVHRLSMSALASSR